MEPDEPDFADALIGYLRRYFECPALAYDDRPTPLALGTEASILGFSLRSAPAGLEGPLVLRAMISNVASDAIVVEHAVQNAVAQQGFQAPRVIVSSPTALPIGTPFMVMTRLPGEHRPDLPDAVELQMQALAELHGLDPEPVDRALEVHGVPESQRSASCRLDEAQGQTQRWGLWRFRRALEWLERRTPAGAAGSVICHGDPHLYNMLFAEGRVSAVLDWGTARISGPEMDVGLLCGYARCRLPVRSESDDASQRAVDRLIVAYQRYRPVNDEWVLYFETEFLLSVLVDMTDRLIQRRRGQSVAPNPLLDAPGMAAVVRARLEAVMGLQVPIPEEAAA